MVFSALNLLQKSLIKLNIKKKFKLAKAALRIYKANEFKLETYQYIQVPEMGNMEKLSFFVVLLKVLCLLYGFSCAVALTKGATLKAANESETASEPGVVIAEQSEADGKGNYHFRYHL